jgi:hypothetical protein
VAVTDSAAAFLEDELADLSARMDALAVEREAVAAERGRLWGAEKAEPRQGPAEPSRPSAGLRERWNWA